MPKTAQVLYVQQMSCCITLTKCPQKIILIKNLLCKASPSLLFGKICLLGLDIPQGGSVCVHVTSVSALKNVPLGSASLEGVAEAGGHVQRDLFDLHQWSVCFLFCLCEIKGVYIFPMLA